METIQSGCKVNLFLNVLRKREDGFHELETVMQPLALFDRLSIVSKSEPGIELACDHPEVPLGADNLIHRAASRFQERFGRSEGLQISLEKRIPVAAGVGGGSGNAAATLLGLNRYYDEPLSLETLEEIGAELGSDIPFFLRPGPALATGRGERVESLAPFELLSGAGLVLVNPGFGISTPWAYQNLDLAENPGNRPDQTAAEFVAQLRTGEWDRFTNSLFNSLEQPVFKKYPVLYEVRQALVDAGADAALLSGSGATVFGLVRSFSDAETVRQGFLERYGESCWSHCLPLGPA